MPSESSTSAGDPTVSSVGSVSTLGAPEPPAKLVELREEFDRRVLEGLAPEQRERYHAWLAEQREQLEQEGGILIIPH